MECSNKRKKQQQVKKQTEYWMRWIWKGRKKKSIRHRNTMKIGIFFSLRLPNIVMIVYLFIVPLISFISLAGDVFFFIIKTTFTRLLLFSFSFQLVFFIVVVDVFTKRGTCCWSRRCRGEVVVEDEGGKRGSQDHQDQPWWVLPSFLASWELVEQRGRRRRPSCFLP